jgi:hypothetical protein
MHAFCLRLFAAAAGAESWTIQSLEFGAGGSAGTIIAKWFDSDYC